ncbi:MAG: DNA-3-methyladenine glycosylase [Bacteroidia bacterium]
MIEIEFYQNDDVCAIARNLIGMELFTHFEGDLCSGYIVETEAYAGINDKASHAYGGRFTSRTSTMYENGGIAYVYLCYGMHALFNVVTNKKGIPHAVLIRAIQTHLGYNSMAKRRNFPKNEKLLGNGPGTLTKSLGIQLKHNGLSLNSSNLYIKKGLEINPKEIISSPRVGVAYAKEDAKLPYRYRLKGNPFCSPAK